MKTKYNIVFGAILALFVSSDVKSSDILEDYYTAKRRAASGLPEDLFAQKFEAYKLVDDTRVQYSLHVGQCKDTAKNWANSFSQIPSISGAQATFTAIETLISAMHNYNFHMLAYKHLREAQDYLCQYIESSRAIEADDAMSLHVETTVAVDLEVDSEGDDSQEGVFNPSKGLASQPDMSDFETLFETLEQRDLHGYKELLETITASLETLIVGRSPSFDISVLDDLFDELRQTLLECYKQLGNDYETAHLLTESTMLITYSQS